LLNDSDLDFDAAFLLIPFLLTPASSCQALHHYEVVASQPNFNSFTVSCNFHLKSRKGFN
jgi:hypothetical protein